MNISNNPFSRLDSLQHQFERETFVYPLSIHGMRPALPSSIEATVSSIFEEALNLANTLNEKQQRKELKRKMIGWMKKHHSKLPIEKIKNYFEALGQCIGPEKAGHQRLLSFDVDTPGADLAYLWGDTSSFAQVSLLKFINKSISKRPLRPDEMAIVRFLAQASFFIDADNLNRAQLEFLKAHDLFRYIIVCDLLQLALKRSDNPGLIGFVLEHYTTLNPLETLSLILKYIKISGISAAKPTLERIINQPGALQELFRHLIIQILEKKEAATTAEIALLKDLFCRSPCLVLNEFSFHVTFIYQLFVQNGISLETPGLFAACPFKIACEQLDFHSLNYLLTSSFKPKKESFGFIQRLLDFFFQVEFMKRQGTAATDPDYDAVKLHVVRELFKLPLRLPIASYGLPHYETLISLGIPLFNRDAFSSPPLYEAAIRGNLNELCFLLRQGANISVLFDGFTVRAKAHEGLIRYSSHLAARRKNPAEISKAIIEFLISKGASISDTGEFEDSLFANALREIDFKIKYQAEYLDYLQKEFRFSLGRRNSAKQTMLLWALSKRDHKLIQNLLKFPIDFEAADSEGKGVIHYALEAPAYLYDELIRLYVFHPGMNPNLIINSQGETLLMALIRKDLTKDTCFFGLLGKDPDIHAKDKKGNTALKIAFDRENPQVIAELLKRGANQFDCIKTDPPKRPGDDQQKTSYDGDSLLIYAAKIKKMDLAELLLAKGASIDMVNNRGETLLHYAAKIKDRALIEFCLKRKANVNARNVDGDTPIVYSLLLGYDESALLFIDQGAELYTANEFGIPPISLIGNPGHFRIKKTLQDQTLADIHVRFYNPKCVSIKEEYIASTPLCYEKVKSQLMLADCLKGKTKSETYRYLKTVLLPIADEDGKMQQLLEACLILNFFHLTHELMLKCEPEKFCLLAAPLLVGRLSHLPIDFWLNHVALPNETWNACGTQTQEAAPSGNADIHQLVEYFDQINTSDPTREDYFNPQVLAKGKFIEKKDKLRASLNELVTDAKTGKTQKKFANPEEDLKKLHRLALEVTVAAQAMTDLRQRSLFILDIAEQAEQCAVGWMVAMNNIKNILNLISGKVSDLTLTSYLKKEFTTLRIGTLEKFSGANVHQRNLWLQAIGKKVQIPEAESLGEFVDAYNYKPLDPELSFHKFQQALNPAMLCRFAIERIKEKLKEDRMQSDHSCVLTWFESHVPEGFQKTKYHKIKAEIEKEGKNWKEVFDKYEIAYNPASQMSWQEALEKARGEDYISSEVFPNYAETPEFGSVVHLLREHQMLHERIPGMIGYILKLIKQARKNTQRAKRKTDEMPHEQSQPKAGRQEAHDEMPR